MITKEILKQYQQILPEEDYLPLREEYDREWELFNKECLNLTSKEESKSRLEMALERLDKIQPQRSKAELKVLKQTVKELCLDFFHERRNGDIDFARKGRQKNNLYKKSWEKMKAKLDLPECYNPELPYSSAIHENYKHRLRYPKPIKPMQEIKDPEVNSLLFQLTLLFKKFSDLNPKNGEWNKNLSGQMPNSVILHFDIVTDIFNAVVNPLGTEKLENEELEVSKVRDRIRHLKAGLVELL